MRQIEELKEGTAKKEAELVEIKKAQAANVSVHNWKFPCYVLINHRLLGTQGLFTWSGEPRSSGVGFFCFHALGDTKQKKPTPLDRGPPFHVNRVLVTVFMVVF